MKRRRRGKGESPTHVSRTSTSKNNASLGLKFRVHVSRKFPKEKDSGWLDLFRMLLSAELIVGLMFCLLSLPPQSYCREIEVTEVSGQVR